MIRLILALAMLAAPAAAQDPQYWYAWDPLPGRGEGFMIDFWPDSDEAGQTVFGFKVGVIDDGTRDVYGILGRAANRPGGGGWALGVEGYVSDYGPGWKVAVTGDAKGDGGDGNVAVWAWPGGDVDYSAGLFVGSRGQLDLAPIVSPGAYGIYVAGGLRAYLSGDLEVGGAITPAAETANPCASKLEGSLFYNQTGGFPCYCGPAAVALRFDDSACFAP